MTKMEEGKKNHRLTLKQCEANGNIYVKVEEIWKRLSSYVQWNAWTMKMCSDEKSIAISKMIGIIVWLLDICSLCGVINVLADKSAYHFVCYYRSSLSQPIPMRMSQNIMWSVSQISHIWAQFTRYFFLLLLIFHSFCIFIPSGSALFAVPSV